jgi:hypothetical protein
VLRARLRALLESEILPALERSFDAMDRGRAVVHVQRMDLNAALRGVEDLAQALPTLVERALAPVLRAPVTLPRAEAILAYLETGSFPWHVAADQLIALIRAEPAVLEEVARVTPLTPQAAFRALQLLPEERWSWLASPPQRPEMARIAADRAIVRDTRLRRAAALLAASDLKAPLARDEPPEPSSPRAEEPRAAVAVPQGELAPAMEVATASVPRPPIVDAAPVTRAASGSELQPPPGAPGPLATSADGSSEAGFEHELAEREDERDEPPPEPAPLPATSWRRSEPFGRPAPLAGLILVAPFLPRFLEQTQAKRSGASTIDDVPRATALLHALAAGDAEPFEHDLGFIKVLLGTDSLQIGGGLLTRADFEEVDSLLHAVIDHWGALKKTSPKGLQSAFLGRPGLIREDEHGLRLQVEPSPFDVLLDQLPWTFGVVKLPWMNRAIMTEWRT